MGTELSKPLPPSDHIPPDLKSLADYERRAQVHMEPATWRHIQGGAGLGKSLADNRRIFDSYQLIPRVLTDMRGANSAINLLGQDYVSPIFCAPLAYHRLVHADGEIAAMRAAAALGVPMMVSTLSSYSLEDIAAAARETASALGHAACPPLWFQLYFQANPAHSEMLVRRAEAAGYSHIVVTIDASVKQSGFALPAGVDAVNLQHMPRLQQKSAPTAGHILFGSDLVEQAPTWESVRWLRKITALPIIVKGILAVEDAKTAVECGADAIILSNHGGRVLDDLVHPLTMMSEVRAALGENYTILVDSGFRTGGDIVKALALGANAVLIGRPMLHALAVAGMQGCAHMLHLLRAELELAMIQLGCIFPSEISAAHLRKVPKSHA